MSDFDDGHIYSNQYGWITLSDWINKIEGEIRDLKEENEVLKERARKEDEEKQTIQNIMRNQMYAKFGIDPNNPMDSFCSTPKAKWVPERTSGDKQ